MQHDNSKSKEVTRKGKKRKDAKRNIDIQSGTGSRTPPETKTGNSVDESVAAADTQQKVERPGQAEVLACADAALKKLEKVDADSKENHNKVNAENKKRKSQIVQEFARDLEEIGFPTDRIAAEITQQLYKKVSKSLILGCLDEKYKTSYRVENALKRKKKKKPEVLAPVVQEPELKSEIVVDTSGHQMVEPAAETRQHNNERTTNTESKEESTITPSFNASPIKETEEITDTKKKVLVSIISIPGETFILCSKERKVRVMFSGNFRSTQQHVW
jgi:hypothetical protein